MSEDIRSELHSQFHDAFSNADYPVSNPMELAGALPDGPSTSFEAGHFSMTAMELQARVGGDADYPYESVDALVDDLLDSLEEKGEL